MAHLDSLLTRSQLAESTTTRHTLALNLIATLLDEERILIGDVVGGDPAYIEPWPGTHHDIVNRIRELYIDNYAQSENWVFRIWFSLNDSRMLFHPNDSEPGAVPIENPGK